MKKAYFLCLALGLVCLLFGDAAHAEKKVLISELPDVVVDAAESAVEGIELEDKAEVLKKGKTVYYEFDGVVDGKEYEIHVDADGKVLKAERD